MERFRAGWVVVALLASMATSTCAAGERAPEPAKPVELSRYLGLWHEIARYPNGFEKGCGRVTADYRLRPDGLVAIVNSCAPTDGGKLRVARGRAKVVGGDGAKLKVSFFGPFFSDYWVIDRAEDYSWALVGDSRRELFWILARRPELAGRAAVLRRAEALGYDTGRLIYRAADTAGSLD